jgi:hypothetical protein
LEAPENAHIQSYFLNANCSEPEKMRHHMRHHMPSQLSIAVAPQVHWTCKYLIHHFKNQAMEQSPKHNEFCIILKIMITEMEKAEWKIFI